MHLYKSRHARPRGRIATTVVSQMFHVLKDMDMDFKENPFVTEHGICKKLVERAQSSPIELVEDAPLLRKLNYREVSSILFRAVRRSSGDNPQTEGRTKPKREITKPA